MKLKVALLVLFLSLWLTAGAEALDMRDATDSQFSYGTNVAALTGGGIRLRGGLTLVLMRTDGSDVDLDGLNAQVGVAGPDHRYTLGFSRPTDAVRAVEALSRDEHVLYAELDGEVTGCDEAAIEDITYVSYGAQRMAFSPLNTLARRGGGQVEVALIDSGVYPHPSLSGRLTAGWDYLDNDADPTNDESGHGTHVAGIVADCTQGTGVRIRSYRVLNASNAGSISNTSNAILQAVEDGCPLINLSLISSSASGAALDDAVHSALSAGCVVIVAAGNAGTDTASIHPACLTDYGVIVVGAADESGSQASYSNHGASVDMYAYGSSIVSCATDGGYITKTGTSMAAPHVTAACALLWLADGPMSPAAVESRLRAAPALSSLFIPRVGDLAPQMITCRLTALTMGVGDALELPTAALPEACNSPVRWIPSDETVITVADGGVLTAVGEGTAILRRSCANFDDLRVTVTVTAASPARLALPEGLVELDDEALSGVAAAYVTAGDALTVIGDGAIDGETVLLCASYNDAARWAEAAGVDYIAPGP